VFVAFLGWVVYLAATETGEGRLELTIADKFSGRSTPAMMCLTSLADGKWRTPPDGRTAPPYTTTKEFYTAVPWKPGQPGPVRLTNGDFGDNDVRSYVYQGKSSLPFWQEPAAYFVAGTVSMTLPAGKYRLALAKGIEYLPVFEEFEVRPGESVRRRVALERWANMPARGWYSGDDHVHHPRLKPEDDEFLMTWAQAEDVHVVNILRMGDIERTYFEQRAFGRAGRFQRDDHALVAGQEDPRTDIGEQGHTIALNITAPVRNTSRYHLYDFMFDGAHEQGGLVGYAHKSWAFDYRQERTNRWPTWDSTISVPRGRIDFFEIMQFRRLGLKDFYDFLNLGWKLTASAGSDLPWGNTIGEVRVYAYTGPEFSADRWFEAMKKGRTFVTNGPMVELAVDAALPGDEIAVRRRATLKVRAKAWAPAAIGAPAKLEIVAHGRVIGSAESTDPKKSELVLNLPVEAERSQWIAARVSSHNGGLAHTSPVYVRVDGKPFHDETRSAELVKERLAVLDYIEGLLRDQKFTEEYAAGEVEALRKRIGEARGWYRAML
jgi:hypothetical protein